MQVAKKLLDDTGGPPPGNGALFGLVFDPARGVYFVDDASQHAESAALILTARQGAWRRHGAAPPCRVAQRVGLRRFAEDRVGVKYRAVHAHALHGGARRVC